VAAFSLQLLTLLFSLMSAVGGKEETVAPVLFLTRPCFLSALAGFTLKARIDNF
jgi:hypothetical protein